MEELGKIVLAGFGLLLLLMFGAAFMALITS